MTTTEKLVEKLEAAFAKLDIVADRIEITYPQGYWKKEDVYRWEGSAVLHYSDGRDRKRVQINSWDTATECAAKGDLLVEERQPWEWEAHSPAAQVCPNAELRHGANNQQ